MFMALIQGKAITKDYVDGKNVVRALRGVELTLEPGEFAALAGPSGSGKTTLLNLIGGLDSPTSGSLHVRDTDLSRIHPRKLNEMRLHHIGFVFQSYNLIPVLTARENVEFTMLLQGVPAAERKARALEVLEQVSLTEEAERRPSALSGGQQQRVAVARAIVTRPAIVLADEPTANLDSQTGSELLDLMRILNLDHGVTFLFSTHDPMVMEYSRRLIRLHDGTIESDERK
jgi:putative ABC transport system ATP-binding protein